MNRRYGVLIMPVVAVAVGGLLTHALLQIGPDTVETSGTDGKGAQCAHWAIFRCCQILGVSVTLDELLARLPVNESGHSLADVRAVLRDYNLEVDGRRETWESLDKNKLPAIAHFHDPDHFVVVNALEHDKEYLHVYDGAGHRACITRGVFVDRWTGAVLYVSRRQGVAARVVTAPNARKPGARISFEYYLLDKGDVPCVNEAVEFAFPFRNEGATELVIRDIHTNCSCVKSHKPAQPIPPNGNGAIMIYHVPPKEGAFSYTAIVETNDPQASTIVLTAAGFSRAKVRLVPSRINLSNVYVGRRNTATCFVNCRDWVDCEIRVAEASLEGVALVRSECCGITAELARDLWLNASRSSTRTLRNVRVLRLTFLATGKASDEIAGKLVLSTHIPGYERLALYVRGKIAAPIQACPSILDFGEVAPSELLERSVTLVSRLDEEFEIVAVDTGPNVILGKCPKLGGAKSLTLAFKTTGCALLAAADKRVTIRARFSRSGEVADIALPLVAWPRTTAGQ